MTQYTAGRKPPKALILLAIFLTATVPGYGQIRLDSEDAAKLIIEKPEAIYPPLAKQLRLQGTVKADVSVSETGSVIATRLIGGHPILVTPAMDAVKEYIYKPYVVDGKPSAFVSTVDGADMDRVS